MARRGGSRLLRFADVAELQLRQRQLIAGPRRGAPPPGFGGDLERLREIAGQVLRPAKMHVGAAVVRVDCERALELARRLVEERYVQQDDPEQVVRFVESRTLGDRRADVANRRFVVKAGRGRPREPSADEPRLRQRAVDRERAGTHLFGARVEVRVRLEAEGHAAERGREADVGVRI